jgi:molybdate-binding protein/DNA-binding transcriptional regulator YhcF (GntR family)
MIEIQLNQGASTPVYQQIAEQIRQLVATKRLEPGEQLPTVRHLAASLHINPGTVARAYLALEQEKVVVTRRGGGTMVSARADDPKLTALRQNRLSNLVNKHIVEALALGFGPEELEATFHLHLSRWRESRIPSGSSTPGESKVGGLPTILIVASHDLALNILVSQFRERNHEPEIKVTFAGSLGGLIALQENRAHLAGIHLLDEETGEYNYPYIRHILPGREIAVVHLAYRVQGLMLAAGNPKRISGLEDLRRRDITFVNRQKGSGTRVLLDLQLRKIGISSSDVRGYSRELDSHMAVAIGIARGEADCGLGIEAAARASNLDFVPLFRERYDLVIPAENYRSVLLSPLLEITGSNEFRSVVAGIAGYDTSETGAVTFTQ